jgi:hypothetical protein
MAVEQTAPRQQNAVFRRRVCNPVAPHEMRDRVPMRHGIKRTVDLWALLTENVQQGGGKIDVGLRCPECIST